MVHFRVRCCTKRHKTLDTLKQSLLREWGILQVTDDASLNHGQVTWTTPEPALSSPNYHTNGRMFELSTDLTCIAAPHVRQNAMSQGMGLNPGEGMHACKCTEPVQPRGPQNIHDASSPPVRPVEVEEA
ncbi:hypothetical protein TNCV_3271261 [Trichonephila clavipes]|nr:hypothetical protein TNCV_3271261 [Trichonephila clavipes]